MNPSSINDPAGIKALLDKLRSSQAWQETIASAPQPDPAPVSLTVSPGTSGPNLASTGSVAALLSLLQPPSSSEANPPQQRSPPITAPSPTTPSHPQTRNSFQVHATKQDLQSCSFQQALAHLARLSTNTEFRKAVSNLKQEQADLERLLWDERRAIVQRHESKVKLALTKANLIGSDGLSQYEADVMTEACRSEMNNFDRNRVLPAWDGLMSKQQSILQSLSCPLMYVTNMAADLQRQQRIIQVLEGMDE